MFHKISRTETEPNMYRYQTVDQHLGLSGFEDKIYRRWGYNKIWTVLWISFWALWTLIIISGSNTQVNISDPESSP